MKHFEIEKNCSVGELYGPEILEYPDLTFDIGLLKFNTHKLVEFTSHRNPWIIRWKHKNYLGSASSPKLSITKKYKTVQGFHLRLPATVKVFRSWDEAFQYIKSCLAINPDSLGLNEIRFNGQIQNISKPTVEVRYIEEPFSERLKRENEKLYNKLKGKEKSGDTLIGKAA